MAPEYRLQRLEEVVRILANLKSSELELQIMKARTGGYGLTEGTTEAMEALQRFCDG